MSRNQQLYEDYWKFTVAYTDYNNSRFIGLLRGVVSFIDRTSGEELSFQERYSLLQNDIQQVLEITPPSIRKAINQLVKMGFINTGLVTYHSDAKPYINAHNNKQRKLLLSRIVYSNSSFARTASTESDRHEINFIIKTLEGNETLTKKEVGAIMRMRIDNEKNSFATKQAIEQAIHDPEFTRFEIRKHNQISYLWNLLRKLDGISTKEDGAIAITKESEETSDDVGSSTKGRDNYLQRIYKSQLKEEVKNINGNLECMVDRLDYPNQMYIGSHIKPFSKSSYKEAYDQNNGLLLSLNIDKFFDAGLISFNDDGSIIISKRLNKHSKSLHDFLLEKSLDVRYINDSRKKYLEYHRKKVFN